MRKGFVQRGRWLSPVTSGSPVTFSHTHAERELIAVRVNRCMRPCSCAITASVPGTAPSAVWLKPRLERERDAEVGANLATPFDAHQECSVGATSRMHDAESGAVSPAGVSCACANPRDLPIDDTVCLSYAYSLQNYLWNTPRKQMGAFRSGLASCESPRYGPEFS